MDDRDERLRARLLTRDRGTFCDVGQFDHPGPYRRYAITVEGEPLRVQPVLCPSCGDRLLLGIGHLIGLILKGEETGGSRNQVPAVPPSSPPEETEPRPPVLTKGGGAGTAVCCRPCRDAHDFDGYRTTRADGRPHGLLPCAWCETPTIGRVPVPPALARFEVTETPAGAKLSIKPVKR